MPRQRRVTTAVIAAVCSVTLILSACNDDDSESASSGDGQEEWTQRVVTVDGVDGPGPAEYDEVRVVQQGPEDAKNVFVFVPGTSAGASYFLPVGEDIVNELPGWQVWSVDRRENLLEDHSLADRYLADDATNQEAFDYYLGWIADDTITEHFEAPTDDEVGFAREWGMEVAIGDLQAVIQEAAALGGKVVLGGHSLGGSITVAYATWDFEGRSGADALSGIALIDGGSAGGEPATVEEAQAELADLEAGSPFNDLLGLGLPWAPGVFNVLGASAARLHPDEASIAYDFALLPENLKPPVLPTNAAQYGYALDVDTSPENIALVHMSMGQLAESGEPRRWDDADAPVPVARAARMFSGLEGIDGTAWYHPARLSIDSDAVNGGIENPAQDLLGVRAIHGRELRIPIYALETGFGQGRVLNGARALAEQSGLDDDQLTLVEEHSLTHTDPIAIERTRNPLVETLVPFLRDLG